MMKCARLFVASLISGAWQLSLAQISCLNNGNYTSNSPYAANLNMSFQALQRGLGDNGFFNASVGQVNIMVLCRGDAQLEACRQCIEEAAVWIPIFCPLQKQAIRWEDRCTLRFSDAAIHGSSATNPMWYWWDPNNVTSPAQFEEDLRGLLGRLRVRAASGGSLRKVAAGEENGPDFQTIYAMLQCTPDLSEPDCTTCLINAISNVPTACDGKKACGIVSPSCNVRFDTSPSFYNQTRLRELDKEYMYVSPSPPAPGPVPVQDPPSSPSAGNTTRTIIIIVVPIVLSLIILGVAGLIWLRRKRKSLTTTENRCGTGDDEISSAESLQYAFSTIQAATNDFSDDNKLGQGGFGSVYKGKLPNGREIAVKRLSMESGQGDLEFKNEVLLLAKLQHRNLVRLLGFAIQGMEKLLIYELVQNASLDRFIFDQRKQSYLDWDGRYKIIGGIARGVLYLHEDSRLRIIHRDLKPSNILVDGEMNPKIADFGMARLFGQDETQGNTSRVVGTFGYMPPEYMIHGQFSIKSDVFSFGVLVLEIISGRKNSNFPSGENAEDLLSFAWKNWRQGTAADVVSPWLRAASGSGSVSHDMLRCIHIGLLCVQENATERPTMASVVIMLSTSASSISLAVPSVPAFYNSQTGGNSRDHENHLINNNLQMPADRSDHSSNNDVSITELHPR